jgi:hypothetical protein
MRRAFALSGTAVAPAASKPSAKRSFVDLILCSSLAGSRPRQQQSSFRVPWSHAICSDYSGRLEIGAWACCRRRSGPSRATSGLPQRADLPMINAVFGNGPKGVIEREWPPTGAPSPAYDLCEGDQQCEADAGHTKECSHAWFQGPAKALPALGDALNPAIAISR